MEKQENEQLLIEGVEAPNFSDAEKNENLAETYAQENPVYETEEGEQLSFSTDVDIGISKEYADEKLKEVLESQSPKKKKKKTIINLCLLLVNIVFMVYIINKLIANVGDVSFSDIISKQGSKLWWLAGGLVAYLLYILAQVLMYTVLIKDLTGKRRIGLAYDVAIVGKYYDNVTPFAVGGQPMQIIRLAENGISPGVSTSIPIIKMLINSMVNMLLVIIFFVFGLPKIPLSSPFNDMLLLLLEILGVIGVVITVVVTLFMFLISTGNFVTRSVISGIVRLGYKMKIVKNYRVTLKKFINQVSEYKTSMSYLWKHKKLLVKMILLSVMECLTYAIMPYFVVMAFAGETGMSPLMFLFICIVKYYICSMASSYIPLPGGTGLMEISFIFLFGIVVNDAVVWALLIWRFLSYYLILVHGFTHELIKIVKNLVANRKKREVN